MNYKAVKPSQRKIEILGKSFNINRLRIKLFLNHQGQASVFVLALMGVVLVATIFLYQSGRVTSEKMQLQNAADAAAFGASTLEARSLNFSAYTNRAMVANEVAIGQMVGILSMVDEVKSFGEYLQAYGGAIEVATGWLFAVVTVGDVIEGIISGLVLILEEVGEDIALVGETIAKVLDVIATPVVTGLSINNEIYSVSQQLYHGATMVLVTTNMFKSLEDNTYGTHLKLTDLVKRKRSGAQVSDLGLISLAMHMPSYLWSYTKRYSTSTPNKGKKKKAKKKLDKQIKEYRKEENQQRVDDQNKADALAKENKQKEKDLKKAYKQREDKQKTDDEAQEDTLSGQGKIDIERKNKRNRRNQKANDLAKEQQQEATDLKNEKKQKIANLKKENKKKIADLKKENQEKKAEKTTKKKTKKKKKSKNDQGMKRLAATVRNARDPFTSGGDPVRVKNYLGMEVDYKNRDWFLGLELILHPHKKIDFGFPFKASFNTHMGLSIGIRSKGGSEIRYKDDTYIWSGLDTLLGGPGFKWDWDIDMTVAGIHKSSKGDFELELGLPLGGGVSQAIKSTAEDVEGGALTPVDFIDSPGLFTLEPYAYGEAGKGERMIMVEAASVDLEDNQVDGYSGLKAYRDRNPDDNANEDPKNPPRVPFKSPFFLVGLTRQMTDITDKGPQFNGKLDLINDADNNIIDHIGVIAKSQVYFSRPQDLSYFLRDDGKKEKSNVFSPFWQARLVNSNNLDRILVLAMQDHVIWLSGNIQDDVPGLRKVIQFLQDIFGVFR